MQKTILICSASLLGLFLATGCQTTQNPNTSSQLTTSQALMADDEDDQMVAVSDPDYDPDKIICKTNTATNSRLRKTKDCRTAEEWRRSQSNATRSINDLKDGVGRASSQ